MATFLSPYERYSHHLQVNAIFPDTTQCAIDRKLLTRERLHLPSEATALLAEEEPGLTCTSCGARCPGYFRHCFNCGQPLIREESSHSEEE
jgi:hypothetical protein